MAIEIKTAMDWPNVEGDLMRHLAQVKDPLKRIEAKKVLKNFEPMITKLSMLELEARRSSSHSTRKVDEQLLYINNEILALEQWITLLLLL